MSIEKGYDLEITAGPCSADSDNVAELYQLGDIETSQGPAIRGARVVGLKSRTAIILEQMGVENNGMGIDFAALEQLYRDPYADITVPSVKIAEELAKNTGMVVSTEIMMPDIQMPHYAERIPAGQGLFWSPSVNALGWQVLQTARAANDNGWEVGIKNAKFLGVSYDEAQDPKHKASQLEKTWSGQVTYAQAGGLPNNEIVLIHRGVDVPEKGNQRNAFVHEIAGRVKDAHPDVRLYLDPTHSLGPKLRDQIVDRTLDMMTMKRGGRFLYDGVIFEAGTSKTDTDEHITLQELNTFANDVSKFRNLRRPPARADVFAETARRAR